MTASRGAGVTPGGRSNHRAVLTDLGGVILVITQERFQAAAARYDLKRDELYQMLYSSLAWRQLELGAIDLAEYWRRVVLQAPTLEATSFEHIDGLLFGEDRGLNRPLLTALEALRPRCRLGILTNNHQGTRRTLEEEGIAVLFDAIVISAEDKVAKPSEDAFRLALARLGAAPEETVFIDDNPENVWVAQRLGMAGIEHRSTEATLTALGRYFPASRES